MGLLVPPDPSHYEVLGVPEDAEDAQIKSAYKKLALKYHPDKQDATKQNADPELFHKLHEAYSLLMDKSRRGPYDLRLQREKLKREELEKLTREKLKREQSDPVKPGPGIERRFTREVRDGRIVEERVPLDVLLKEQAEAKRKTEQAKQKKSDGPTEPKESKESTKAKEPKERQSTPRKFEETVPPNPKSTSRSEKAFLDEELRFTEEPDSTSRKYDENGLRTKPKYSTDDRKTPSARTPMQEYYTARRKRAQDEHAHRAKARDKTRDRERQQQTEAKMNPEYLDSDSEGYDSGSPSVRHWHGTGSRPRRDHERRSSKQSPKDSNPDLNDSSSPSMRYWFAAGAAPRRDHERGSSKRQSSKVGSSNARSSEARDAPRRRYEEDYDDPSDHRWKTKIDDQSFTAEDYMGRTSGSHPTDRYSSKKQSPYDSRPERRSSRSPEARPAGRHHSSSRESSYEDVDVRYRRAYEVKPAKVQTFATTPPPSSSKSFRSPFWMPGSQHTTDSFVRRKSGSRSQLEEMAREKNPPRPYPTRGRETYSYPAPTAAEEATRNLYRSATDPTGRQVFVEERAPKHYTSKSPEARKSPQRSSTFPSKSADSPDILYRYYPTPRFTPQPQPVK